MFCFPMEQNCLCPKNENTPTEANLLACEIVKKLSLRASAHAGVAIRSLKCSVFMKIADKNARFGDADCHVASLLAMTFFRLELIRHTDTPADVNLLAYFLLCDF